MAGLLGVLVIVIIVLSVITCEIKKKAKNNNKINPLTLKEYTRAPSKLTRNNSDATDLTIKSSNYKADFRAKLKDFDKNKSKTTRNRH